MYHLCKGFWPSHYKPINRPNQHEIDIIKISSEFSLCLFLSCKSKELERNKEETKREFRGNSDDIYFMLIRPIYRLIVRRPKAFT